MTFDDGIMSNTNEEPARQSDLVESAGLTWLTQRGAITAELAQWARTVSGVNESPLEALKGKISWSDLHEAAIIEGRRISVVRLVELPEWTTILNDAGGDLGCAKRSQGVAVIANDKEPGASDQIRCFIVHAKEAPAHEVAAAVVLVLAAGYHHAGSIAVEREVVANVYGEWDGRGKKPANRAGGETAELHAEFDDICEASIDLKASDIHISSTGNTADIRVRVDGEIEHFRELTAQHALELCASIYNTLTESSSVKDSFNYKKALDATIERSLKQGLYRFRFSNMPKAPSGFAVTLRIIPIGVTTRRQTPEQLGYSPDQALALERMFAKTAGLILFAGTTGSGKSTSMANLLRKVAEDRPGKKIRSVEEPVEFVIPGVDQHPVTRISGDRSDFLIMLRQLMRADPDIIMVGEIRDGDTADLAIQAVRSGHLCVSTIHADGAPICYDRLVGMGINRLDLASVNLIAGLVYQKLVPILCTSCRVPFANVRNSRARVSDELIARVIAATGGDTDGIYFRSEGGCEACRHRGAVGRTVCAEILRPSPDMLNAIASGDSRTLWKLWRKTIRNDDQHNMIGRTAFEHALAKMSQGIVSPEDVEKEFHFLDETLYEGLE